MNITSSIGPSANIERLVTMVLMSYAKQVEQALTELADKMNEDLDKVEQFNKQVKVLQSLQLAIQDPDSDDKKYKEVLSVTYKDNSMPLLSSNGQATVIAGHYDATGTWVAGVPTDGSAQFTKFTSVKDVYSGKQLYTFYEQEIERVKGTRSALLSVSNNDQLKASQLQGKISAAYQQLKGYIDDIKNLANTLTR